MKRAVLALLAVTALPGCITYSLHELRQATPSGTPFQNALARYYLDFASQEERAYDWFDSMYFADKGLRAAYGKDTAPEELERWDIPKDVLADFESTRAALVGALTPQVIAAQPEVAAAAQFYFDCWVEQQEERWQAQDIARCRDGVKNALQTLDAPPEAVAEAPEPESVPAPTQADDTTSQAADDAIGAIIRESLQADAPAGEIAPTDSSLPVEPLIVFFEAGDITIPDSADRVINEVIEAVKAAPSYDITLGGHTDTAGDAEENLKISMVRAETVKKRLVEGGLKAQNIKVFAFGETDPRVRTQDNVANPANARVEITINE